MNHITYFISDLHLNANDNNVTAAFFSLLENCKHNHVDALYILGDFFEAWIGDDNLTPYHQSIITVLKNATDSGLPIYFMHGNRDFLVGDTFLKQTGCRFIDDETVIDLYGNKILLMHGDVLCTADKQYLRGRRWMRNKTLQKLFLLLPLTWRRKIADHMRQSSGEHMKTLTAEMMDVSQSAVEQTMNKHGVQHLIHGHTHKPNTHTFTLGNQPAQRIVLAAWHHGGSVLTWNDDQAVATLKI